MRTTRLAWQLTLFVGMLGVLPSHASAQATPATSGERVSAAQRYRYRLLGTYDSATGEPVGSVEVADVLGGSKTETSAGGVVSLFFLPEGASIIRLRKPGYELTTLPVMISPTDTAAITVLLTRVTELPAVVIKDSTPVTPGGPLRRFEERRARGFGSFITEAELRKSDSRPLSNVIADHVAGLRIVGAPASSSSTGYEHYLTSGRKECGGRAFTKCLRPNCYPRVYVDGIRFSAPAQDGGAQPIDFDRMSTTDYAAVEYYGGASVVPPEYASQNDGCGVLLLWSRTR